MENGIGGPHYLQVLGRDLAVDAARQAHDDDTLNLVMYQIGVAWAYGREWRLAERCFTEIVNRDSSNYAALANLAVVRSNIGQHREALAAYERLLSASRQLAAAEPAAFRPDVAR